MSAAAGVSEELVPSLVFNYLLAASFLHEGVLGMLAPFAFFLTFLLLAVGGTVDISRAVSAKSKLAAAADAAGIAGARALSESTLTDAKVTAIAVGYFTETLLKLEGDGVPSIPQITINRTTGDITVSVTRTHKNLFGGILGFSTISLPVTATAQASGVDVELAMVLDITGSMAGQKLTDLKTAASNVIDTMLVQGTNYTTRRISLVPFAEGVNAGNRARTVTGNASSACVHERGGQEKFSDAAPTGSSTYLGYTWWMSCPSATVRGLSTDAASLKTTIQSLAAAGGTAGHIGLAWGWYTISPKWGSIFPGNRLPAAYDPKKTLKAILLMTDGDFNTEYILTNGTSFVQAAALCTAIKSQGIILYTVGFDAPFNADLFLKTCASSPAHHYSTQTGAQLLSAFQNIAKSLNKLRLTQ